MSYDTEWHYVGEVGEPEFEGNHQNYPSGNQEDLRFRRNADGNVLISGVILNDNQMFISNREGMFGKILTKILAPGIIKNTEEIFR